MRPPSLFSAVLSLVLATTGLAASHDGTFELRQLTEDNFRASVARGMWLVEHYSPKCSHCRAFAPVWEQLAKDKQHLERLAGLHMAQVNCLAQGDLCNSNGIKFYPQIVLYADGHPTPYNGDRSSSSLSEFMDTHAASYARTILPNAPVEDQESAVAVAGLNTPNHEGKVVEVDEKTLDALTASGPVLVDFYAPWCSHCKKLRPIYDQLGESLKGKINVAAVNCDANSALCRKNKVQAYPSIKLWHKDTWTDYRSARTAEKMHAFAMKAAGPTGMESIKYEDFDRVVNSQEAFFLYLQNFDTSVEDLASVKALIEPLPMQSYTSADPLLYANLSIANPPPTSVLLAFSSYSAHPVSSLAFPASADQLNKFVNLHRFPTLVKLTAANYNDVMKSSTRALVVLAALSKGKGKGEIESGKEYELFKSIARAWKRGGRDFSQPVWFVYVEGEKWGGWLRQSYGIKKNQLPAVVVVDPPLNEYYDMTIEGLKVELEGNSVFSVLEGVYNHFLRAKKSESALEWGSRSATMTLITTGQWTMDHPFLALVSLCGGVALFVFLLQRCIPRDSREPGGHAAHGSLGGHYGYEGKFGGRRD